MCHICHITKLFFLGANIRKNGELCVTWQMKICVITVVFWGNLINNANFCCKFSENSVIITIFARSFKKYYD